MIEMGVIAGEMIKKTDDKNDNDIEPFEEAIKSD